MLLLLVTAILAVAGIISTYYMYSNDIVEEDGTFQETMMAKNIASDKVIHLYYLIRDCTYEDETINDFDDYASDYVDETGYYYDYLTEDGLKKLEESEINKNYIIEEMNSISKNYKFNVVYNGNTIISNITGNKDDLEWITNTTFDIEPNGYISVESYLNKNLEKGDLFYRKSQIFNFFRNNFDQIKYISIISGIIAVILFVYIMIISGYNDKGELAVSWIDSIPYEILLILKLIITYIFMTFFPYGRIITYIYMVIIGSIWYLISINVFTSTLSRFKNKVFIKNSIIGKIIKLMTKFCKTVFVNVNTKWKAIVSIAVCIFCEFILVFVSIMSGSPEGFVLWLLIKAGQFIILMYIFSMIVKLKEQIKNIYDGSTGDSVDTSGMSGIFLESAEYLKDISAGLDKAVSEKVKSEQLKTELITNVSHDIKTPLTSIINYIDLMNKENIQNEKVKEYIVVAHKQSLRLKKLTEDLIEASKAATGNIQAELEEINVCEMITQSIGEYTDKFMERQITPIFEESSMGYHAMADGRLLWRVIDNLFSNVCKYALEGTRLYVKVAEEDEYVKISIKNISKYQLNITGNELMERFVRGDLSRSTSGNGLGLSIAKSLVQLQRGYFDIDIDGDLFTGKIILTRVKKGNKDD